MAVETNGDPVKKVYDQAWQLVTNEVAKRIADHNEV